MREELPQEHLENLSAEEEPKVACDLCRTLWPAGALENGACPDCLEEDGRDRI